MSKSNENLYLGRENDVDIELISFNIDNLDMNDDNNRYKLEPLKKLFEKEKTKKSEED